MIKCLTILLMSINNYYFSRDTFEVENQMMPENSMKGKVS